MVGSVPPSNPCVRLIGRVASTPVLSLGPSHALEMKGELEMGQTTGGAVAADGHVTTATATATAKAATCVLQQEYCVEAVDVGELLRVEIGCGNRTVRVLR